MRRATSVNDVLKDVGHAYEKKAPRDLSEVVAVNLYDVIEIR
jgi:hypothetical protein